MRSILRRCLKFGVHFNDLGVRFALDDFGTGFSSLTYLRRLPVDQIKIDRSFVRDMLDDPEDLGIIEGVLGLSLVFRREVVAEGVESVEHGEMLLQLGCQLAQGYEIARPMPATDLAGWLEQWRPARSWTLQRKAVHDDLPLLFAGVEHFAWTRSIKEYLTGDRAIAPDVDVQQCRFGQWLDGIGQIRHGNRSCFLAAKRLHDQMHDIANQLIALKDTAPERNAKEALDDLHSLQNQMTEQLDRLKAEES